MNVLVNPYKLILLALLCVALSPYNSHASCVEKAPQLQAVLDPFLSVVVQADEPGRLSEFCHSLKSHSDQKVLKKWESSSEEIKSFSKFLDFQTAEFKKEYAKRMAEVELQSSPTIRAQKAYELAVSLYGYSKFVGKEAEIEILRQMANRNSRGTDAQKAAFTAYTLQKLLPAKSFKVRVIVAHPTKSLIPETWVQLYDGKKKLDLKTGADFIPMPANFEKLPASPDILKNECAVVMACLLKGVKS